MNIEIPASQTRRCLTWIATRIKQPATELIRGRLYRLSVYDRELRQILLLRGKIQTVVLISVHVR